MSQIKYSQGTTEMISPIVSLNLSLVRHRFHLFFLRISAFDHSANASPYELVSLDTLASGSFSVSTGERQLILTLILGWVG